MLLTPLLACGVEFSSATLKSRYDQYSRYFVDRKEVISTEYQFLINTKTENLSDVSKRQFKNALAVYKNPNDEKTKRLFLDEFPDNFEAFFGLFNSSTPGELSETNAVYIDLLGELCDEYPQKGVGLLLNLSKDASYQEEDATGLLQDLVAKYAAKHFDLFLKAIKKMPIQEQENVSGFLADVENFDTYPEYATILKLLKRRSETKLYNMFLNSKKARIQWQQNDI